MTTIVFLKEFIICDDFNIHNNKFDDLGTIARNKLIVIKFNQLVSWQTHRSGNRLDLIMVLNDDKLVWSESIKTFHISDNSFKHLCLYLYLGQTNSQQRKVSNNSTYSSVVYGWILRYVVDQQNEHAEKTRLRISMRIDGHSGSTENIENTTNSNTLIY